MDGAFLIDGQVIVPVGLRRFEPGEQTLKREAKARGEGATYDMVNGWLSKPSTVCPLHVVSVVTMRTCGHVTPKNGAKSDQYKNKKTMPLFGMDQKKCKTLDTPSSCDSAQNSPVISNAQDEPSCPQGMVIGEFANEQIRSG